MARMAIRMRAISYTKSMRARERASERAYVSGSRRCGKSVPKRMDSEDSGFTDKRCLTTAVAIDTNSPTCTPSSYRQQQQQGIRHRCRRVCVYACACTLSATASAAEEVEAPVAAAAPAGVDEPEAAGRAIRRTREAHMTVRV